jgi:hypothetical protein
MGWVLYSTKWVKSVLYREPQHKTQPQHTTTNMSRCRPTHQRLWVQLPHAADVLPQPPLMLTAAINAAALSSAVAVLPLPLPLPTPTPLCYRCLSI